MISIKRLDQSHNDEMLHILESSPMETDVLDLKATCNTAAEAFKYLQLNVIIDLLFLDINMPQQSGLDLYKTLKNPPQVIFTTAYPHYDFDGFEVNAVDYLLKPILKARNEALRER